MFVSRVKPKVDVAVVCSCYTDEAIFNFQPIHEGTFQGPWLVSGWKEISHDVCL